MTPAGPAALAARLAHDRGARYALVRYLGVGSFVAVVDVGTFQALVRTNAPLVTATTLSLVVAACVHFTLNKLLTFRDHRRGTIAQAATYAVVAFLAWALTLLIVTTMTRAGLPPVAGKVTSIAANVPFGFLCHRFVTFGPGIRASLRRLGGSAGRRAGSSPTE